MARGKQKLSANTRRDQQILSEPKFCEFETSRSAMKLIFKHRSAKWIGRENLLENQFLSSAIFLFLMKNGFIWMSRTVEHSDGRNQDYENLTLL